MPIEIRELVISTRINDEPSGASEQSSSNQGSQEELVATCVEKVMDLLKQQMER